jgi:hypothetical protein
MAHVSTTFNPLVHGFRFINRFDFPYLFNVNLPLIGSRGIGDIVIGLCGGMCASALDYYKAGVPVPTEPIVDNIELKLFRYLWNRQMDTLSTPVLERLLTWAIFDTRTLSRLVTRDEVPKLMQRLDAKQPVILVLLRARGFLSLTQNHQVLAVGYDYDPTTKDLSINLYDPNHPGQKPTLNMNLTYPGSGIKLSQSTGEPLRAFYVTDYTQSTPPAA